MNGAGESPAIKAARVLGFALLLLAAARPIINRIADPFEDSYHGGLTAWFALMSENMERSGFIETRALPPINPNPAVFRNFRYYVTHPVGDVVLRAGLMRVFGYDEWVARLQGSAGLLLAALGLYLFAGRFMSRSAAAVAALAVLAFPMGPMIAHLSMHHAMTIGLSALALALAARRYSEGRAALATLLMLALLFLAAQCDWPGYFAIAAVFLLELGRPAPLDEKRAMLGALVVLGVAAALFFVVHVSVIGEQDLLRALQGASANPGPKLAFSDASLRILAHYRAGLTDFGVVLALASPLLGFALRRPGAAWAAAVLLVFGVLNPVVFFAKAPFEDFWGCYALLAAAFGAGLFVDFAFRLLKLPSRVRVVLVAAFAVVLALAPRFDADARAVENGRQAKQMSAMLVELIDPADRSILITNFRRFEMKLVLAYARLNVHVTDFNSATMVVDLGAMAPHFHHVSGGTALLYLDRQASDAETHEQLGAALKAGGAVLYNDVPDLWNVTSLVWR